MKEKNASLLEQFRKTRKQILLENEQEKPKKEVSKRKGSSQSQFQEKYKRLPESIDEFTVTDLLYFYQEVAQNNGGLYTIKNKPRDMAVLKKLTQHYTMTDICLMIEFIYMSGQTYLDKDVTQPTVLASGWQLKIYKDSQLWGVDKYHDKPKTKNREWQGNKTEDKSKIGSWE